MDGEYKNGVEIIVTYQAVNCATGKTITMDVYDAAHALDAGKSIAEMVEIGTTGRYYATFTPDAEGEWIAVLKNTTDNNGELVKAFSVGGHNVDSLGDDVAALDGKVVTVDGKIEALENVSAGDVASAVDVVGALETYDGPTKAEMDSGLAPLAVDATVAKEASVAALNDVSPAQIAAELETYDGVKKAELDAVQGGSETLQSIKGAVNDLGSPAVIG